MIDDQIRKYARADISDGDMVKVQITRIATNLKGAMVNPIPVQPINISARGIKFSTNLIFTTGIMLDLSIKLEDKIIQTTGKLVRMEKVDETFKYAVSFSLLKEYNKNIISNFVKRKTIDHIQHLRGQ
jgi:hypothetical protein